MGEGRTWLTLGGGAASEATCLTLEVPPAELAEWCTDGRPLGLPDSVAGDVNPRDGGQVCVVAARVWCAPEHGTHRREKEVRDSGE